MAAVDLVAMFESITDEERAEAAAAYEAGRPKPAPAKGPGRYCGRCDGSGFIPQFAHIDGGRCWECDPS